LYNTALAADLGEPGIGFVAQIRPPSNALQAQVGRAHDTCSSLNDELEGVQRGAEGTLLAAYLARFHNELARSG
jgi:hypothetical protein